MVNRLINDYPIAVEKGNTRFTLNITDREDVLHTAIIITISGAKNTRKGYRYEFNYEYEAFEEIIYLINENINKSVLFGDSKTEGELLDILVEFDRFYKQLKGD